MVQNCVLEPGESEVKEVMGKGVHAELIEELIPIFGSLWETH
jgi:hypothetical protein